MGWKASCILASAREDGYLGTFPAHDPDKAVEIVNRLGLGAFKPAEPSSFEDGLYPPDNGLYIGAYDGAVILGSETVAVECLSGGVPPLVGRLAACLPDARMLVMGLHSVVNFYGYAYYENGRLIRVRAGSADDGPIIEHGSPLPEEEALFARSLIKDGQRVFLAEIDGQTEEYSEDAFGEEFVFDLSAGFSAAAWTNSTRGI